MNSGVRLAADANVILAAAMGGTAARIMRRPEAELFTTRSVCDEVEEYLVVLAARKRLSLARMEWTFRSLPFEVVSAEAFAGSMEEAVRRIGRRDLEDAPLLALALYMDIPIWSNDRDFEVAGVQVFTTSMLMKRFLI